MNARVCLLWCVMLASALVFPARDAFALSHMPSKGYPTECREDETAKVTGAWQLKRVPLAVALQAIAERAGWRLSYSSEYVPPTVVSVWCAPFNGLEAVHAVLRGTGLRAVLRDGLLIVVPPSNGRTDVDDTGRVRPQQLPAQQIKGRLAMSRALLSDAVLGAGIAPTVLDADSLIARGVLSLADALRGQLPGLAAWDRGPGALRVASVRGRGADGGAGVKIFVDGIEVADPSSVLSLDMRSIAEMQWLPGAAGAAAYGTDALDGVLAIRTRAALPADDAAPSSASVRLGAAGSQLQAGSLWMIDGAGSARWTRAWGQTDDEARQGPRASRLNTGVSGSYQQQDVPGSATPIRVAGVAWSASVDAKHWRAQLNVRGAAGRQILVFEPTPAASSEVTRSATAEASALDEERVRDGHAGLSLQWGGTSRSMHAVQAALSFSDRDASSVAQRLSVLDSIRVAWRGPVRRWTARYRGEIPLGHRALSLSLAGDAGHLVRNAPDSSGTANALGDSSVTQSLLGGSAIVQAIVPHSRLSLGLRREWNSAIGQDRRWFWLPSAGAEFDLPAVGALASRIRVAYGSSARAPAPSMSAARSTSRFLQRANPALTGERQRTTELGISSVLGSVGTLDLTAFRQRTEGFTQLVVTGRVDTVASFPRREFQYRVLGTVEARGLEFSGTVRTRWGEGRGSGTVLRSRVVTLASGYSGVLSLGATPLEAPQRSGAASWTVRHGRSRFTVGASVIGAWRTAAFGCVGSRDATCAPRAPATVPALARWYAAFDGIPLAGWRWRVRGENLSDNQRVDGSPGLVGPGRSLSLEIGRW
ncbi:TonB-dependent receptor [Gemmatimonas sp.]|uniref:TonB-dependent receptor plug domain-containing protein n=1 Tax=Gemmatimonas sp. TaxID=1962908 RepID=UPI00333FC0EC